MTTSTSKSAYTDCFDYLDQALAATNGIRIPLHTRGAAYHLVTRLHYARKLSREEAQAIYAEDDPKWGTSVYDVLIVRTPRLLGSKWYVYIEPRSVVREVEELGAAE